MCVGNSVGVLGGKREFRRHCQNKGITDFYIRLSPISEQVDTKVVTHNSEVYVFDKFERNSRLFKEIISVSLSERY